MDRLPENSTEEYSSYIDDIIDELITIKNSLK